MAIRLGGSRSFSRIAACLVVVLAAACGGSGSSDGLYSSGGGGGPAPGGDPQVPGPGLTRQFGSARFDGAVGAAVDGSENIYVAGNTWGTVDAAAPNPDPTAGTSDVFVAKFDRNGTLQWIRQTGTPFDDVATGIAVDAAGNATVVGFTFGDLAGANRNGSHLTSDYFLVRFNPAGQQVQALQDGTDDLDEAWAVVLDGSGNAYLAGGTRGNLFGLANAGDFDAFVASYDNAGVLRPGWPRAAGFNLENRDFARALAVDHARGFLYTVGDFSLFRDGSWDTNVFVEQITLSTGTSQVLWAAPFPFGTVSSDNTLQLDYATGVAVDRDGAVYVGGYTIQTHEGNSSNAGDVNYELFKLDPSGNFLWHNYVVGGDHPGSEARGLVVDSMKDVYLTGYTSAQLGEDPALGGTDAFLTQFDGDTGATLWTRQFGTAGNDRAFGVAFFDNRAGNDYYVVGETSGNLDGSPNLGGYDAFLVRYGQSGERK